MFLFHPIHFLKFLVKSQPQRSYKNGSYIKKECILADRIYQFIYWFFPLLFAALIRGRMLFKNSLQNNILEKNKT